MVYCIKLMFMTYIIFSTGCLWAAADGADEDDGENIYKYARSLQARQDEFKKLQKLVGKLQEDKVHRDKIEVCKKDGVEAIIANIVLSRRFPSEELSRYYYCPMNETEKDMHRCLLKKIEKFYPEALEKLNREFAKNLAFLNLIKIDVIERRTVIEPSREFIDDNAPVQSTLLTLLQ